MRRETEAIAVNSSVIRTKKNSSGFDNQTGKTYTAIARMPEIQVNRIRLALQPAEINKSINLCKTNAHKIDLALKIWSFDVISPMLSLTTLNIAADLLCHPGTYGATSICLLCLKCPTFLY